MTVTDASGSSVCVEPSIATTSTGRCVCTLLAGKTAPFLVVVTDPSAGHAPLVSVATTTPAAGTPLVVNATPLTTAIVSQLVPGGDALALAETKTLVRDIDATALAALTSEVVMQLASALSALGMPTGHDPFATPITAATASASGNTADKVIEPLRFTSVNGVTTVATVDAPDARVPLTTLTRTAAPLPAPSASAASLADITHLLAAAFNKCFAVPAAGRILERNTTIATSAGGPEIPTVAAACDDVGIWSTATACTTAIAAASTSTPCSTTRTWTGRRSARPRGCGSPTTPLPPTATARSSTCATSTRTARPATSSAWRSSPPAAGGPTATSHIQLRYRMLGGSYKDSMTRCD